MHCACRDITNANTTNSLDLVIAKHGIAVMHFRDINNINALACHGGIAKFAVLTFATLAVYEWGIVRVMANDPRPLEALTSVGPR